MALLALLAATAGFIALCLAMPRHRRQFRRAPLRPAAHWRLRCLGAAGLGTALLLCAMIWGIGMGAVAWLGLLTGGGLALVFLLPALERLSVRR